MCKILFGLRYIEEWRRPTDPNDDPNDPSLDHCKLFPRVTKGLKIEYLEVRIFFAFVIKLSWVSVFWYSHDIFCCFLEKNISSKFHRFKGKSAKIIQSGSFYTPRISKFSSVKAKVFIDSTKPSFCWYKPGHPNFPKNVQPRCRFLLNFYEYNFMAQ